VSTPKNCTCTYLAEHLEDVSHDVVNDFLHQKRFMPREVWNLVIRAHDIVDKFLTEAWLTTSLTFLWFISLQKLQPSRKGPLYRPLRTVLW
jgi:hypothetical protein